MNTGAHTPPNDDEAATDEAVPEQEKVSAGEADAAPVDTAAADGPSPGAHGANGAADPSGTGDAAGAAPAGQASAGDDAVLHEGQAGPEGNDPGGNEADVHNDLPDRLAAAEARADQNWDRLLRLQADMENQRKRAQRDLTNARKFALEGIVGDLLPVRDSLEMGLAAAAEEGASLESLREGAELTLKMLASALERHNIVAIDPVGEKFNPEFHQAMTSQPAEGVAPNTVVSVMQKGYTLNERLIRPALVMVAK